MIRAEADAQLAAIAKRFGRPHDNYRYPYLVLHAARGIMAAGHEELQMNRHACGVCLAAEKRRFPSTRLNTLSFVGHSSKTTGVLVGIETDIAQDANDISRRR